MDKLRITIDNCVINTRSRIKAMNQLEEWHKQDIIEIQRASAMDTEFKKWTPGLQKSKQYKEEHEVFRWGVSRWDHAIWGGKDFDDSLEQILDLLFPQYEKMPLSEIIGEHENDFYDALHLATHKLYGNDIFVTTDKNTLNHTPELKKEFGINVMTPEECVKFIENRSRVA